MTVPTPFATIPTIGLPLQPGPDMVAQLSKSSSASPLPPPMPTLYAVLSLSPPFPYPALSASP